MSKKPWKYKRSRPSMGQFVVSRENPPGIWFSATYYPHPVEADKPGKSSGVKYRSVVIV